MRLALAVYLIGSVLPAVAQEPKVAATPSQWQYEKEDDPLHGKVHARFILEGVYLTPPHLSTKTPALVVECTGGKVDQNYFSTGAVIVHRDQSQNHGMLFLEGRIDGKKSDFLTTGLSTDGQSAFFMRIDLKGVLAAKQVIVGVYEYMGGQVVIRFDVPDPAPVMAKCGEDRMLRQKKAKAK